MLYETNYKFNDFFQFFASKFTLLPFSRVFCHILEPQSFFFVFFYEPERHIGIPLVTLFSTCLLESVIAMFHCILLVTCSLHDQPGRSGCRKEPVKMLVKQYTSNACTAFKSIHCCHISHLTALRVGRKSDIRVI